MPATLEALAIIILIVMPGFLCWQLLASHIPNTFVSDAHSVITSLIFSILIHLLALPVTISLANKIVAFSALLKEVNGQNSVAMDWSIFAWLVTVLFILPVIVAFIISWFWRANWSQSVLEKIGLSLVQRTPKAWDWFFLTQKQGFWIIAELDDGTLVGGQYGPESFSSLSPDREDLYLETCYYVDEYHNFHDPIPDNVGTWINGDKVKKLHFYRVGGEENDGNAQSN